MNEPIIKYWNRHSIEQYNAHAHVYIILCELWATRHGFNQMIRRLRHIDHTDIQIYDIYTRTKSVYSWAATPYTKIFISFFFCFWLTCAHCVYAFSSFNAFVSECVYCVCVCYMIYTANKRRARTRLPTPKHQRDIQYVGNNNNIVTILNIYT